MLVLQCQSSLYLHLKWWWTNCPLGLAPIVVAAAIVVAVTMVIVAAIAECRCTGWKERYVKQVYNQKHKLTLKLKSMKLIYIYIYNTINTCIQTYCVPP